MESTVYMGMHQWLEILLLSTMQIHGIKTAGQPKSEGCPSIDGMSAKVIVIISVFDNTVHVSISALLKSLMFGGTLGILNSHTFMSCSQSVKAHFCPELFDDSWTILDHH